MQLQMGFDLNLLKTETKEHSWAKKKLTRPGREKGNVRGFRKAPAKKGGYGAKGDRKGKPEVWMSKPDAYQTALRSKGGNSLVNKRTVREHHGRKQKQRKPWGKEKNLHREENQKTSVVHP